MLKLWFFAVASVLIFAMVFFTSCVPVAVGMGIWSGQKHDKQKAEFVENFNKTNMEREINKLEPLDFCTEAIRYNSKWAYKLEECKHLKPIQEKKKERRF